MSSDLLRYHVEFDLDVPLLRREKAEPPTTKEIVGKVSAALARLSCGRVTRLRCQEPLHIIRYLYQRQKR